MGKFTHFSFVPLPNERLQEHFNRIVQTANASVDALNSLNRPEGSIRGDLAYKGLCDYVSLSLADIMTTSTATGAGTRG